MCLVKPYDPYFLNYYQFTVKNGHNFSNYFCIIFKIHIEETGVLLFAVSNVTADCSCTITFAISTAHSIVIRFNSINRVIKIQLKKRFSLSQTSYVLYALYV